MVLKCPLFVNVYTIGNVNAGRYVVQKGQNFVNVVCERPLTQKYWQALERKINFKNLLTLIKNISNRCSQVVKDCFCEAKNNIVKLHILTSLV